MAALTSLHCSVHAQGRREQPWESTQHPGPPELLVGLDQALPPLAGQYHHAVTSLSICALACSLAWPLSPASAVLCTARVRVCSQKRVHWQPGSLKMPVSPLIALTLLPALAPITMNVSVTGFCHIRNSSLQLAHAAEYMKTTSSGHHHSLPWFLFTELRTPLRTPTALAATMNTPHCSLRTIKFWYWGPLWPESKRHYTAPGSGATIYPCT